MVITEKMKSAASERMAGSVRPLEERDIAQVADLHARVFRKTNNASPPSLQAHLSQIFLQHPWYTESLPSLVFQENGSKIVGCIGVMPRPMLFNGRRITAAVSHSFIVEPGSRSTLAALELAKSFLSGPQDLSIAEGSNVSRRIWEKIGGSTSLLYSLCWTRPLRPSRYVLSFLRRRGLPAAFGWALRPFCQLADAVTPLIPQKPFRLLEPPVSGGELDAETLRGSLSEFTKGRSLRPQYDQRSSSWLLETLAQKKGRGTFEKVVVRNSGQETVGWYLYYRNLGGIGEVVQIGARDNHIDEVLDHLFYHAKRRGLVAVAGQVDPAFFHALSKKDCLFHHDGGSWMLLHSRHPELLHAIHRGDAFLTRLEGEWWISFLLS
jgi:hypothetical protein